MASERTLRAAAAQGAVLLAGAAAAWAAVSGLYASALTAGLAGAWLAAARVEDARGVRVRMGRSAPQPAPLETPLLRALLNEAPAPLLLLEPGGAVRALNRAARTLFDTEDRLVRPPPQLLRALREDAAGGRRPEARARAGSTPSASPTWARRAPRCGWGPCWTCRRRCTPPRPTPCAACCR